MIDFFLFRAFCEENLGTKYVEARTPPLEKSYQESNSTTAMFFILSPGVDPLKVKLNSNQDINVSMSIYENMIECCFFLSIKINLNLVKWVLS